MSSDSEDDSDDNVSDSEPPQSHKVGGRICDKTQKGGADEMLAGLC